MKLKKLLSPGQNNEFLKCLNFIVVSDSNSSYVKKSWLKIAKFWRFIYIILIMFAVLGSFIPLMFIGTSLKFNEKIYSLVITLISLIILLIDYFLRWITYPVRIGNKSKAPLLFFPFSGVSLVMILAILPTLLNVISPWINQDLPIVSFFKIFSFVKVLRLLLLLNIFKPFKLLVEVFEEQKTLLINVFILVAIFSVIFALIFFSLEYNKPNTSVKTFFDAFYFTIITITTIGYGDITPTDDPARVLVIFEAIVGVIMFTIPSGIISGAFMQKMSIIYKNKKEDENKPLPTKFERLLTKYSKKFSLKHGNVSDVKNDENNDLKNQNKNENINNSQHHCAEKDNILIDNNKIKDQNNINNIKNKKNKKRPYGHNSSSY